MTSVMSTLVLPQVDENLDHDDQCNDHDDQCNEGGDHTYNMNYISVTSG